MTNESVNKSKSEKTAINIDLINKVSGATLPGVPVLGNNTLGQIIQEYASDIGVNPNDSKIIFVNKRTGSSTSDMNETVEGFDLREGDVLAVSDNAGVAADDKAFEIDLINKVSGATLPGVPVLSKNTLGQILQEYAADIGVNPNDSKIIFVNKRTGSSTSDINETVASFDLREGDVLAVSDNAGVAANLTYYGKL